jgi:glycosyltransferase involved in cell wall biosynthesis
LTVSYERPLVSVIIPVYNGERYLVEAIESVLSQDYRPLELIVVDDGSTDKTAEIARSYGSVKFIQQGNLGAAAARNTGLKAASGAFIAFLDADDLWAANKLCRQMNHLLQNPQIDYTIVNVEHFVEPGMEAPQWMTEELLYGKHSGYLLGALVARKSVFDRIGGFDTTLITSDDADWWFRAEDANIPMALIPETLLYRRVHKTNLSYDTGTTQAELLKVIRSSISRKRQDRQG